MFSNFYNENHVLSDMSERSFYAQLELIRDPKINITVTALKHENKRVHVHCTVRSSSLVLKAFWKHIQNVSVTD